MTHVGEGERQKRIVQEGYNRVAAEYSRLEGEVRWPRMAWLRRILDRLGKDSAVLDLGCGSAVPAGPEIAKTHRLTGVDISQAQINLARRNVPTGRFILGDAGSIDFPSASFDAVVSFYTIEHIPRREHARLFLRIHDWLNDGGLFLLSTEASEFDDVTAEWLGVPMYFSCHQPETTKQLVAESGFELLDTAIESQIEGEMEIEYLWLIARKQQARQTPIPP